MPAERAGYLQAIEGDKSGSGGEGQPARVSFLTAALLGCALAFHSFLEVMLRCRMSWDHVFYFLCLLAGREAWYPELKLCAVNMGWLQGAALGAQETADRTLDIFVAIAAHKVRMTHVQQRAGLPGGGGGGGSCSGGTGV